VAEHSSIVVYDASRTDSEVVALAGYLAGYSGRTREAYALDLRQFRTWASGHDLALFEARGRISSSMPGSWRRPVGPGPPSPGGSPPWSASTATPRRRD